MKIIDVEQGSEEWLECRRGIPTASNFGRILTPKTGKPSTQAMGYVCELVAERYYCGSMDDLTGPATAAMRNGLQMEPEARRWYEMQRGVRVDQVGFTTTDDGRMGASPDALVGDDGGVEIKCPMGKTQIQRLLDKELPSEYAPQVHGCMIVTGRRWWDFMSYFPGLPELLIRVEWNGYTDKLSRALDDFLKMYSDTLARLNLPEPAKPEPITEADIPGCLAS